MATTSRTSHRQTLLRPATELRLRQALEGVGLRYTAQRATVFACLDRLDCHPTAEDVYRRVRRSLPRISLATVYKALDALAVAGLIAKLAGDDGRARYDCRGTDHYHLRDTRTGEVKDLATPFDPDLLTKLDPRLVQQLARTGFQVSGYRLEVLGERRKAKGQREMAIGSQRPVAGGGGEVSYKSFRSERIKPLSTLQVSTARSVSSCACSSLRNLSRRASEI